MKRLLVGLLLSGIPTLVAAEDWKTGFGQGFLEYRVQNGPGNEFNISCDVGASAKEGEKTQILIQIVGKSPPPSSIVNVILDGDTLQVIIDKYGVGTTDCHACYSNFIEIWKKIRTSRSLLVQYSNGVSAKFGTGGARAALTKKPCKTAFEAY